MPNTNRPDDDTGVVSLTEAQVRELKHACEKHGLRLGDRGRDEAAEILHKLDRRALDAYHNGGPGRRLLRLSFEELKLARSALDVHELGLRMDEGETRRANVAERAKATVEGVRASVLDKLEGSA